MKHSLYEFQLSLFQQNVEFSIALFAYTTDEHFQVTVPTSVHCSAVLIVNYGL